ncbi:MAG TPA: hypothetical protein VMJ64_14700, partial [Anaerolineales bacterium]|nr:hypothetical protein [Anaerolineales bacterium]
NDYIVIAASVGILAMIGFLIVMRRKVLTPGLMEGLGACSFWFGMIVVGLMAIGRIVLAIAY